MTYDSFNKSLEDAVNKFKLCNSKPVRIISHFDSDGISAASILIKALKREDIKFAVSIVRQLSKTVLEELKLENYDCYMFLDLGSGSLGLIQKTLKNKTVFVLDHHKVENVKNDIIHINPHLFGIDGSTEISGAGIVYLFAKKLNIKNKDMAHIALIGAIGDIQENKGFFKLNNNILEDAIEADEIEVKQGLRMFGLQTKPLHRVLRYSIDPYIPDVTGSEEGALMFLDKIGIEAKRGNKWKKLIHLNEDEMKKLVTGVILKRLGSEKNPEDVLGPIYLLKNEELESPTKDAKEFSTLLNSCGRLRKPSVGIGTCLGDENLKKEAIKVLDEYKGEIINSLNWFYKNRPNIIEEDGFVIVNAEDMVSDSLIGTLASMISRTNIYKHDTIILTMAHTLDNKTKISIRKTGRKNDNLNLLSLLSEIVAKVGGEAGGHSYVAAGAMIDQEKEEDFIKIAKAVLKNRVMEEKV